MKDVNNLEENKNLFTNIGLTIKKKSLNAKYSQEIYSALLSSSLELLNIFTLLCILILFKFQFFSSYTFPIVMGIITISNTIILNVSEKHNGRHKYIYFGSFLTIAQIKVLLDHLTWNEFCYSHYLSPETGTSAISINCLVWLLIEVWICVFQIVTVDNNFLIQFFTNLVPLISYLNNCLGNNSCSKAILLYKIMLYSFFLNALSYIVNKTAVKHYCLLHKYYNESVRYMSLVNNSRFSIFNWKEGNLSWMNPFANERLKQYLSLDSKTLDDYLKDREREVKIGFIKEVDHLANRIKLLLFKDIKVFNPKLPGELNNIIKRISTEGTNERNIITVADQLIRFITIYKMEFKDYTCIASIEAMDKENKVQYGLLYMRYNILTEEVEMAVPNLTHFKNLDIGGDDKYLSLAKITHEFKNPVLTMIEVINTLSEKTSFTRLTQPGSVSLRDKLKTLEDLGNYVIILTKDIDYMSNINSKNLNNNNIDISLAPFKVKEIIQFARSMFETRLKNVKKNIKINVKLDHEVPNYICTDQMRLKQIIINLLSNSLKFTQAGVISLICEDYDEEYIKFSVKDTGIGIKAQHLSLLTKPYQKLSNQDNLYGAGLGLTIVKEFVVILGKDLDISTEYGSGTTVSFLIKKNLDKIPDDFQDDSSVISETSTVHKEFIPVKSKVRLSCSEVGIKMLASNEVNNSELMTEVKSKTKPLTRQRLQIGDNVYRDEDYMRVRRQGRYSNESLDSAIKECSISENCEIISNEDLQLYHVDTQKFNIIVVDDDLYLRQSQQKRFNEYGRANGLDLNIIECEDGIECLTQIHASIIKGIKIHGIVTDQEMNFIQGNHLAKIIRSLVSESKITSIKLFMSSSFDGTTGGDKLFDGAFKKPLNVSNMQAIINSLKSL